MKEGTIFVESASDCVVVINVPELSLRRTFQRRGAKYPFDRELLEQAYYDVGVEQLFKSGMLITDDKQFLEDVGLAVASETTDDGKATAAPVYVLTEQLMNRIIKLMPVRDAAREIGKMSRLQIDELVEYAISHYTDLQNTKIELLSSASGKNILKAIELYKAGLEGQ